MAHTVVVTAAAGPLGARVCRRAAADPAVDRVVAIDRPGAEPPAGDPILVGTAVVEHHRLELDDPDVEGLLKGADTVVHLGTGSTGGGAEATAALGGTAGHDRGEVGPTRALLAASGTAGVRHLVVLSSALVYGAWPGNPVPLTEAAPLRPVPGLPAAVDRAEVERLAARWREDVRGPAAGGTSAAAAGADAVSVAVLRPVVVVGDGPLDKRGRSLWRAAGLTVEDTPPLQFVHVDDVATAVDTARRDRLDGPFNVAPDGWLSGDARRGLSGPAPRVPLPAPVAERLASLRWRLGLTGVPPGVLPYTMYSWVVSNDRLKAAGWAPTHTNEEAFVEADPGSRLSRVHPRRRQLLSLAALGGVAAGAVGAVAVAARRLLRRR